MVTSDKLQIPDEWKEFLKSFLTNKVEFVVVGGVALAAYGQPRWTGDLDVLINPTPDNASAVLSAISEFGFGDIGLTERDFLKENVIIQLGRPPRRIDILTGLSGVSNEEVFSTKTVATLLDLKLPFIGRDQLIKNKLATQRSKDLSDAKSLQQAKHIKLKRDSGLER